MRQTTVYLPCQNTVHKVLIHDYGVAFLDHAKKAMNHNIALHRITAAAGGKVHQLDACSLVYLSLKMARREVAYSDFWNEHMIKEYQKGALKGRPIPCMTHFKRNSDVFMCGRSRFKSRLDGIKDKAPFCGSCLWNLIFLSLSGEIFSKNISRGAFNWIGTSALASAQQYLQSRYGGDTDVELT